MTIQPTDWPMCVPPEHVAAVWPDVSALIESAYAEVDEFMPTGIPDALVEGRLLLWISVRNRAIDAALLTALLQRPSGLACKLMVAAGVGGGEWAVWHQRIESYARAEGCVKLFAEGRPGWGRVLPGYQTKRIVLEKRI